MGIIVGIVVAAGIALFVIYTAYCYATFENSPIRVYKMRHMPSCGKCKHCCDVTTSNYYCDIIYANDDDKIWCTPPLKEGNVVAAEVRGTKACKFVARSDNQTEKFYDNKDN